MGYREGKGEANGAGGIDGAQMMFTLRILMFNLREWKVMDISEVEGRI